MTLEQLKKCKDIMSKVDMPDNREFFVWNGDTVQKVAVKPKPNLDILRNRLAMYGMSLNE